MSDDLAQKIDIIKGTEFDWFAVDSEGYVGHFSTAGSGLIPLLAIQNFEDYYSLMDFFSSKKGNYRSFLRAEIKSCYQTTLKSFVNKKPEDAYLDWLNVASFGIYSYDWPVNDNIPYEYYYSVTFSDDYITIDNLPGDFNKIVSRICFKDILFRDFDEINPANFFECM
jgi:hypothetical protein